METRRVMPYIIGGTGLLSVAVVGLITLATGGQDYAALVPAPDSIVWEEGQKSTVLVATNLDKVHLAIDSVAIGIDSVKGAVPQSGELMVLGASVGCQDWAVSRLYADSLGHDRYTLRGEIERDNFTGTAEVYARVREVGDDSWTSLPGTPYNVLGGSNDFSQSYSVSETIWEVEASSNDSFPLALTRQIRVNLVAKPETSTTDAEVETIVLLQDTGVELEACSEHDDLTLYLYDDDGEELNHYVVDVGAPPTATATPIPNPAFVSSYQTLRFCPDADAPRGAILTGAEAVGTVTAAGNNITYSLAPDGDSRDFAFFNVSSSGALTVSATGADDHTGIDGARLYTFKVVATDGGGRRSESVIVVQLDLSQVAPNNNGVCP